MALAMFFVETAIIVRDMGMGEALIQREVVEDRHLSSVFWISVIFSVLLTVLLNLGAPLIAVFFKSEELVPLLMCVSSIILINALYEVHRNWFRRELLFARVAKVEVLKMLGYCVVSVFCAFKGMGVWSLAIGMVAGDVAAWILCWYLCPWKPKAAIDWMAFKELFVFGRSVLGTGVLSQISFRVDAVLIGRMLGASVLGVYNVAVRLITVPSKSLGHVINDVSLPVFSKAQNEDIKLGRWYLMAVQAISLGVFPILVGLAALAPEFVGLVLGEKWMDSVVPIRLLCVVGMARSIGPVTASLMKAKGRPDIEFKWNILRLCMTAVFVSVGALYGINGVAAGLGIWSVIGGSFFWYIGRRMIHLTSKPFLAALAPAVIASLLMHV